MADPVTQRRIEPPCSACPTCGTRYGRSVTECMRCSWAPMPGGMHRPVRTWLLLRTPHGVRWLPPNSLNRATQQGETTLLASAQ